MEVFVNAPCTISIRREHISSIGIKAFYAPRQVLQALHLRKNEK